MKKINVFVSSSQIELENEREIVAEVVNSINLQPVLFELNSALSSAPNRAFLKDVANCDIFVLILWKSFSKAVQEEYKKAVEKNKTVIIKNAISTEDYKFNAETRRKKREELGLSEKVVIGHTGSFAEGKNHSFLIDIFNEIYKTNENVHMIFMGKGSIEEDMKNKAKSLNLENNISFLGVRTDVNEILNAVDIFVFPSKFEGLGIVLIEAQASGLKCVMSDLVPQEAAVTDLVSVVSLDKSAEEWANCVLKEIETSGERGDMSKIISDQGYDISKEALKLQNEYLKMSNVL